MNRTKDTARYRAEQNFCATSEAIMLMRLAECHSQSNCSWDKPSFHLAQCRCTVFIRITGDIYLWNGSFEVQTMWAFWVVVVVAVSTDEGSFVIEGDMIYLETEEPFATQGCPNMNAHDARLLLADTNRAKNFQESSITTILIVMVLIILSQLLSLSNDHEHDYR